MVASPHIPEVVSKALRKSLELGYLDTTRNETGQLLATLASCCTGPIAECGTGSGVGAAWLRSGAPEQVQVITAESDPMLARSATEALADTGIDVVHAEFSTLAEHGPFHLIFADVSLASAAQDRTTAYEQLVPGGLMVIDNVEPSMSWPPLLHGIVDEAKIGWYGDKRFVVSEILVAPDSAVLLAGRR